MRKTVVIALAIIVVLSIVVLIGSGTISGSSTFRMDKAGEGDLVKVDYWLTVEGKQIDTSEGRGLLEFTIGDGRMIKGFDKAVRGMRVGETKEVTLTGADAYTSGALAGKALNFKIILRSIN